MHGVVLVRQSQTDRGVFEVGDQAIPLGHAGLPVPVHLHSGPPLIILLDHSTLGENLQPHQACCEALALFDPKTSIVSQKQHPYARKLNSETPGDNQNAFLHCGDVTGHESRCAY